MMDNTPNAAFAEPWKELWNGDLTLTDKIICGGLRRRRSAADRNGL